MWAKAAKTPSASSVARPGSGITVKRKTCRPSPPTMIVGAKELPDAVDPVTAALFVTVSALRISNDVPTAGL
jgi:hypothetical protein